ncbi:hypothetical protein [Pseudonocardia nigra]|uniref:hypothetical protein n=1 Tax=Pseudonocardia nigra TaxID=1921578 RepID=UPI001FE85685|nr:hypothetical protein [Pseudonocardia nigra]
MRAGDEQSAHRGDPLPHPEQTGAGAVARGAGTCSAVPLWTWSRIADGNQCTRTRTAAPVACRAALLSASCTTR